MNENEKQTSAQNMSEEPSAVTASSEDGMQVEDAQVAGELPNPPAAAAASSMEEVDPNPPRLMITKMILENFKSYGGVREIGPFHKCFSSVVGPNGSGKSNVIDAMLFVFGKRAKKLRLNKVSELIHRSDTYPNLEYARVSVFFQDIIDDTSTEDGFEPVPGTEMEVSRLAFRNNSSKYKLDGKGSNFTEITQILRKRGIDLDHNRFLILQGEVEQISLMKPKAQDANDEGLLEYLEDIIGSNQYVPPTLEIEKEVEVLNEQRSERLNRVKVVEKEKANLEGAKSEAEAFLEKERAIRFKQNVLYQIGVLEEEKKVESAQTKHDELEKKRIYEQDKYKDLSTKLEEMTNVYNAKNDEYQAINTELQNAKDNFAEAERRDIQLKEDLKHLKAQNKKLQGDINKLTKKAEDAMEHMNNIQESVPDLEASIQRNEEKKNAEDAVLEEIHESMKEETAELRGQVEVKQAEVNPAKQACQKLQSEIDTCNTEKQLLEERASNAQKELGELEDQIEHLQQQEEKKTQQTEGLRQEKMIVEERIAAVDQEMKDLAVEEKSLNDTMKEAIAASEAAKSANQQSQSKNRAINGILEAAAQGGALADAGICGRLGDLGTISEEYDVAISTACGMLNHIVVQTTDGAQRCVEYLRERGLGRASFVILDQLGYLQQRMERPFNCPPDCERLFDLIQPLEDNCRLAFYLAVRDTLVAPNLDQAIAVAYQGNRCVHRVVTLDGKMIDTSGAMSGGGKNTRSGGMRATAAPMLSEEELQRLARVAEEAAASVKACRQRKRELEEEGRRLQKRTKEIQKQLPKLEMEVSNSIQQRAELNSRMEGLREQCDLTEESQARVQELSQHVDELGKQLQKASKQSNKLENELKALQQSILDLGGPKLKRQQAKVDLATKTYDEAVATLNKAKVDMASEKKKAEKAEKENKKKQTELEKSQKKFDSTYEEYKQLEEEAFQVMQAYEQAKTAAEEKKGELEGMTKDYEALKKDVAKVQAVEVDILNNLEDLKNIIKEAERLCKAKKDMIKKLRKTHENDLKELGDTLDLPQLQKQGKDEMKVEEEDGNEMNEENNDEEEESELPGRKYLGPLPDLIPEQLANYTKDQLKFDIVTLEGERDKLKAEVNMGALAEYRKKESEYRSKMADLEAVTEQRNEARRKHEELRRKRLEDFMAGFGVITLKLKEMYQMITLGGDAELELVDSLDPFSEGIVFSVRPPKKSWKNISNLSGGEKTLSSLALVFALHHYKPTPLYVMDEIDAALDFKNVSIVANYIKERTKNAQFIIISLRNNMFELADRLVGIYKVDNVTNSVTINPKIIATMSQSAVLQDRTNIVSA